MRITTLFGSPRKKGNTSTILGWMEDELAAQGHEVERIDLGACGINPCLACAACRKHPGEIGCVQDDGAIPVLEKMIGSDAVLLTSPVYFWSFSAQAKLIIDRCYSLVTGYHTPEHHSLMAGKRLGLLAVGAGVYDDNAEGLFTAYDKIVKYMLAQDAGRWYVGRCGDPRDLSDDVRAKAVEFARELAG